jgi:hypothetical protein
MSLARLSFYFRLQLSRWVMQRHIITRCALWDINCLNILIDILFLLVIINSLIATLLIASYTIWSTLLVINSQILVMILCYYLIKGVLDHLIAFTQRILQLNVIRPYCNTLLLILCWWWLLWEYLLSRWDHWSVLISDSLIEEFLKSLWIVEDASLFLIVTLLDFLNPFLTSGVNAGPHSVTNKEGLRLLMVEIDLGVYLRWFLVLGWLLIVRHHFLALGRVD